MAGKKAQYCDHLFYNNENFAESRYKILQNTIVTLK